MKLSNKYGVSEQTIDQMIKDGIIPAHWRAHEEVYSQYLNLKRTGKSQSQIYLEIGEKSKMSEETVKKIVLKMGKM